MTRVIYTTSDGLKRVYDTPAGKPPTSGAFIGPPYLLDLLDEYDHVSFNEIINISNALVDRGITSYAFLKRGEVLDVIRQFTKLPESEQRELRELIVGVYQKDYYGLSEDFVNG